MTRIRTIAMVGAALSLMSGTSSAADLGGNCCADLEERVAELEATTARKGNRKVSLYVYGQMNQAVMYWDDQTESNTYVVNNKSSTTHVGFEGSASVTADVRAGYRIEIEPRHANSDFVDQGNLFFPNSATTINGFGDDGRPLLLTRHSYWWIEHKKLGRVSVGLQSNATDNIAEMDLSKTSVVSLSSVETWNEGFFLRDKNTGQGVQFPGILAAAGRPFSIIGDLYRGNLDGGRGNLIRYDTPTIAGFVVSAAWGEDDDWDVALRYQGNIGAFKVRAGVGYHTGQILDTDNLTFLVSQVNGLQDHEETVGSLSILHEPTGLFVTAAAGTRNWLGSPNAAFSIRGEDYFYVKTGIVKQWVPFGDTSIYGEYYRIDDVGLEFGNAAVDARYDETAEMFGFGIVQQVDNAAMEVYLAYRHYWADDITDFNLMPSTAALTDHDIEMDMVMSGARIKF